MTLNLWPSCLYSPVLGLQICTGSPSFMQCWDTEAHLRDPFSGTTQHSVCHSAPEVGEVGWPVSPRDPFVSTFPTVGSQVCATIPSFLCGCLGLNSSLHACQASSLLTKPFPQPLLLLFSELGFHVSQADIQLHVSCWRWPWATNSPLSQVLYEQTPPHSERGRFLNTDLSMFWKWSLDFRGWKKGNDLSSLWMWGSAISLWWSRLGKREKRLWAKE